MYRSEKIKISLKGRSGVVYSEGDHQFVLESEMLTGAFDLVIYLDRHYTWEKPFESETITEIDKERIKLNVTNNLAEVGLKIDWA